MEFVDIIHFIKVNVSFLSVKQAKLIKNTHKSKSCARGGENLTAKIKMSTYPGGNMETFIQYLLLRSAWVWVEHSGAEQSQPLSWYETKRGHCVKSKTRFLGLGHGDKTAVQLMSDDDSLPAVCNCCSTRPKPDSREEEEKRRIQDPGVLAAA